MICPSPFANAGEPRARALDPGNVPSASHRCHQHVAPFDVVDRWRRRSPNPPVVAVVSDHSRSRAAVFLSGNNLATPALYELATLGTGARMARRDARACLV